MSLCINPHCAQPDHPQNDSSLTCRTCGSHLLLQGRYRVMRLLSDKSGFGIVYEAFDRTTPKILKVLKANYSKQSKSVELFEREANVLSRLHHPGIPAIDPEGYFQYQIQDSQASLHCLVMEKIEGLNLREWMRQQGNHPISSTQALKWLRQLTEILQLVHQNHYFHRDIKPENIMLRSNGQLVLVDFGTAREMTQTYLEAVGQAGGTTRISSAGYTAPEQNKGQAVPQSDFYALGCTFIFLLTGKQPTDFTLYDYINNEFRWRQEAPTVPPPLADLIDRLIATKVGDRPATTQDILDSLHTLESNPAVPASTPCPPQRTTKPITQLKTTPETQLKTASSNRRKLWFWSSAIAILCFGGIGISRMPLLTQLLQTQAKDIATAHTLKGHTGFVNALELSPDGQLLVSGGADKLIKIWSFATGQELTTLTGHTSYVNAIAISPDGKTIVSGSADKTIKVWDIRSGTLLRTLEGHTGYINTVTISPDGKTIASAATDNSIKLWNMADGTLLRTLTGHTGYINAIAISPDGKHLVSASADKTLKVWDTVTGQALHTLIGHTNFVNAIAISPDGLKIVSSSADQTIKVWDLKTGNSLKTLVGHTGYINDIAISPDGKRLISSSGDQTVKVWDLETGQVTRTLTGYGKEISDFALSPDWQSIAESSINSRDIQIWSLKNQE